MALDHGVAWWPGVLEHLDVDGSLRRLWVQQDNSTLHAIVQLHPGSDSHICWTWDEVAELVQMQGEPVRMWVENEADYVHVVAQWVGDDEPPRPFQRVAVGGMADARTVTPA